MIEAPDRVDWGRLTHAYGRADDVPGRIRSLAFDDAGDVGENFGTGDVRPPSYP